MAEILGDTLRNLVDESSVNERNIKNIIDLLVSSNKNDMVEAAQRGNTRFCLSSCDANKYCSALYQNCRIAFSYIVETYHLNMSIEQLISRDSTITFSWAAPANIQNCDALAER